MTLRHLDFPSGQVGLYGTDEAVMLNGIYAQVSSQVTLVDDPDPNIVGNVIRIVQGSPPATLRWVLPTSQTFVGIARRVWLESLPPVDGNFVSLMDWRDVGNNILASAFVDTTGRIKIVGSSDISSTSPALVANAWQHVEGAMNSATGEIEIRVEGVTVVTLAGAVTAAIAQIGVRTNFNALGGSTTQYLKDFAVWDGAGATNNDFMGSIQVIELIPDADNVFAWSASTGTTGFNLVDEAPPNDDTDYIFAVNPPPSLSRFDVTGLPPDITSVKGIIARVRSRKTDGGDGSLQVGVVSGASVGLGADRPITTAYTYWSDVFEVDPATAAPWLPSAVNAVKLQLNRTL